MSRKRRFHSARPNAHVRQRVALPIVTEEALLPYIRELNNPFILILDGVQDPHNLGACLRSAAAAGAHIVIAPKKHTVGITETVRTIACGGADTVPYVQVTNLARVLDQLADEDIHIVGTGDEESKLIYTADLKKPLALVMGSEGTGLRRLTAQKCHDLVRIPMSGLVDCLNLSVATGICLFEAVRQRTR